MELLSWEAGRRLKASKESKLRAEAAAEAAAKRQAASLAASGSGLDTAAASAAGEAAAAAYLKERETEIRDRIAAPAALGAEDLLPLLIYAIAIAPADAASIYGGDRVRVGGGIAGPAKKPAAPAGRPSNGGGPKPLRDRGTGAMGEGGVPAVGKVTTGGKDSEGRWISGTGNGTGTPERGVRRRVGSENGSVMSSSTAGGGHGSFSSPAASRHHAHERWLPTPYDCQRSLQWMFAHATLNHLANFGVAESEWIGRMGFNIIMISSALKWITDYGIKRITNARRHLASVPEHSDDSPRHSPSNMHDIEEATARSRPATSSEIGQIGAHKLHASASGNHASDHAGEDKLGALEGEVEGEDIVVPLGGRIEQQSKDHHVGEHTARRFTTGTAAAQAGASTRRRSDGPVRGEQGLGDSKLDSSTLRMQE